jgi:membrane protein
MRFGDKELRVRDILGNAWDDVIAHHIMTMAAGLSYYFVLSLFPMLILAAAVLPYLPIPNLFDAILSALAHVVPPESMGLVRRVVASVAIPHRGILTFGILGTIWSASSGFAALIEALDVAYDVPETRPIWKTRLLAISLMCVTGVLLNISVLLLLLGPVIAGWIQRATGLDELLELWPYAKWVLSILFTVIGVELMFYWAPNVKQRFLATLPGAVIGVGFFIASSYGLSLYFRTFAHFNKTYGILGAAVALMVWLYYSWLAILAGAEINAELVKLGGGGKLELKEKPPHAVQPVPPWEERPAA